MSETVTPASAGPGSTTSPQGARAPVRTCLGCRRRDQRSSLLRLVASAPTSPSSQTVMLVPDPAGRPPGRGGGGPPPP
ncbi:DUF448 domain-containing protein, partial [Corynebacterium vitaeruminis]|uniref:DUF448 domain-containing protein n=1 Tax=Corynebacterium vitaeruminis TaxID=38305 RepID=UPI0039C86209